MSRAVIKQWHDGRLANGHVIERAATAQWRADRWLAKWLGTLFLRFDCIERWRLARFARQVLSLQSSFDQCTDAELQELIGSLKSRLQQEGITDPLAARCFALVREVSFRSLGKRHYLVQVMGGFAMLHGRLVEMATGEGKTLTALLPTVTVALAGIPAHVITVNDYLAARDAAIVEPVLKAFGLSVGIVTHKESDDERRQAYQRDVVYCVNKDLVFDYLRDGLDRASHSPFPAARSRIEGLYFALIDEADSVLIDEAKTPLVIARERCVNNDLEICQTALALASGLNELTDYAIDVRSRHVSLTTYGRQRIQAAEISGDALWTIPRAREARVTQALAAIHLYRKGTHYVVRDNKIQIVDEYTGRILPDRSWERGLHQMIELKELCEPTAQRETIARQTYPQFFARYLRVSGMSGTAAEVAGEIRMRYGMAAVRIPSNRPVQRQFLGLNMFCRGDRRNQHVIARVSELTSKGRPVLIGSRTVMSSEILSGLLSQAGLEHVVLNAQQDCDEAEIVAMAGQPGKITIATNMAGRGTDIELHRDVRALGGLHVIATELNESSRIDRQLFGRAARQGDPGSYEICVSLEDDLFVTQMPHLANYLAALYGQEGLVPNYLARLMRVLVQNIVEKQNASSRNHCIDHDHAMRQGFSVGGAN